MQESVHVKVTPHKQEKAPDSDTVKGGNHVPRLPGTKQIQKTHFSPTHKQLALKSNEAKIVKNTDTVSDKKSDVSKVIVHRQESRGEHESGNKVLDNVEGKSHGLVKHKHRKSEEVIVDPSVTDLFKPDGIIPSDHPKKEEVASADHKNVRGALQGSIQEHITSSKISLKDEVNTGSETEVRAESDAGLIKLASCGDAGPDKMLLKSKESQNHLNVVKSEHLEDQNTGRNGASHTHNNSLQTLTSDKKLEGRIELEQHILPKPEKALHLEGESAQTEKMNTGALVKKEAPESHFDHEKVAVTVDLKEEIGSQRKKRSAKTGDMPQKHSSGSSKREGKTHFYFRYKY